MRTERGGSRSCLGRLARAALDALQSKGREIRERVEDEPGFLEALLAVSLRLLDLLIPGSSLTRNAHFAARMVIFASTANRLDTKDDYASRQHRTPERASVPK